MSTDDSLLEDIEDYLTRSGEDPTRFGASAIKDPNLVADLRGGRECRSRTATRIRDYIRARPEAAA